MEPCSGAADNQEREKEYPSSPFLDVPARRSQDDESLLAGVTKIATLPETRRDGINKFRRENLPRG